MAEDETYMKQTGKKRHNNWSIELLNTREELQKEMAGRKGMNPLNQQLASHITKCKSHLG